MSTTTSRTPTARTPTPDDRAEQRILIRGISTELFEAIALARGDDMTPRLAWLDGDLELMSPSHRHEGITQRCSLFVLLVAEALGLDPIPFGTATWRRFGVERSKEPDACFYLARAPEVEGKLDIDLAVDPPPDLVIEVEIRPPEIDIEAIYAGLGVPELWRYDGTVIRFFRLEPDGRYAELPRSTVLAPLEPADSLRWIQERDRLPHRAWKAAVERWAREDLADRPA